jgi:branched-subunit amino acid transport protein
MSTAIAMLAVGAVSYLFRVAPLLAVGRVRVGPRLDRTIRHAGAAAVTALFVGALRTGHGHIDAAVLVAAIAAVWLAVRGSSMLRIVFAGAAVYATMTIVGRVM